MNLSYYENERNATYRQDNKRELTERQNNFRRRKNLVFIIIASRIGFYPEFFSLFHVR